MSHVLQKTVGEIVAGELLLVVCNPSSVESWRGAAEGYARTGLGEHVVGVARERGFVVVSLLPPGQDPRRARPASARDRVFDAAWVAFVLTDKPAPSSGDADPDRPARDLGTPERTSSPLGTSGQGPRPRSLFDKVTHER